MAFWGLIAALGAPGWGFWILPWVAFIIPLRWAAQQEKEGIVFQGGFWLGAAYGGLYCLWFFDLHPLTWLGFSEWGSWLITLAGWLLLAVENGLLLGALLLLYRRLPGPRWRLTLFPLLWVLGFALLNITPLALPWTLLETTQIALPALRWLSGWVSGSGLTVLLILHNAFWAERARPHADRSPLIKRVSAWGRYIIFPLIIAGLGLLPLLSHPKQGRWPIPVVIVQAELPIEVIRSASPSPALIEAAYLDPLRRIRPAPGTLAAYPEEGAVPGEVSQQFPESNPFLRQLWEIARFKRIYVSVGVSLLDEITGRRYNALALLSPDGRAQFYRKRRLVPFGETTPYGLGPRLSALLNAWDIDYSASFTEGADSPLLRAGSSRLGVLVCFELIDSLPFGNGYAWQYKRQGATLLLNASNLGWFHQNPWLEAQFLAIARLRAAETRLPLVLASNTGISAILSPMGDILVQSHPTPRQHDLRHPIPHKTRILLYNGK